MIKRLLALLFVVGCGGSTTNPNPPPPPPSPAGPPASVAVQAGADQTGEPGAASAVRPAVVVKDAGGRVVANVAVTFAVDSGGGIVLAPSATTGTDGVATVGAWKLGPAEGRQVLLASVAALPPAKFVATATVPTRVTNDTSIVDGSIEIKTGPLAGTKLVVPTGAYSASANWKFEQKSASDWPRRAGVNPVGPVLRITGTATGIASKPMLLTLPASPPSGARTFVLMRDRATNAMVVLQTVTVDPGSITVAASHFAASILTPPLGSAARVPGLGSLRSQPTLTYDADVVVSSIPASQFDNDVDTGFRPGVDDWDFGEVFFDDPLKPSVQPDFNLGKVATQMAYLAYNKANGGALFNKYREIPENDFSNRVGIRTAGWAADVLPVTLIHTSVQTIAQFMRAGQIDQTFYDVMKANLIVTGLPQLVFGLRGTTLVPFTAYRVVAGRIDLANPFAPGKQSVAVQFTGGHFGGFSAVIDRSGNTVNFEGILATAIGTWTNMRELATGMAAIATGRSPSTGVDAWHSVSVNARGGFVEDTIMYLGSVGDTTRFWVECPRCKSGFSSTVSSQPVVPFDGYSRDSNEQLLVLDGYNQDGYLHTQSTDANSRFGLVVFERINGQDYWADFQWIRVKKWVLDVAPGGAVGIGVPTKLGVSVRGPADLPPHRFVWQVETGTETATVTTTGADPALVTFTTVGSHPYSVKLERTSDGKLLAIKQGKVDVGIAAWKIETASVTFGREGPSGSADGIWQVDSAHLARIVGGGAEGGLYLVEKEFTRTCVECRIKTIAEGLYLLEGTSITAATLEPNRVGFNYTTDAHIGPLPFVEAWPLIQDVGAGTLADIARCRKPEIESFVRTGNASAGTVKGLLVHNCQFVSPFDPLIIKEADVTFAGDLATGVIKTLFAGAGGARYTSVFTFRANRVVR